MIENYQEMQEVLPPEPEDSNFATIGAVYSDGVSLIFDGAEEASEKHYKVNMAIVFKAGDRVKILKDSGTFVVEYPVGPPSGGGDDVRGLPPGGTTNQVLYKRSVTDYDAGWSSLTRIRKVINQAYTAVEYDIEFRTLSTNDPPLFQIRMGPSGVWRTITTTG